MIQVLRREGRVYREAPTSQSYSPPTSRGQALVSRYRLERFSRLWACPTWDAVLGSLDLLDRLPVEHFPVSPRPSRCFKVLDVGAASWRYVGAIAAWLEARGWPGPVTLTGIEIQGWRRMVGLYTPRSLARYFQGACAATGILMSYRVEDVRQYEGSADLITWFLPLPLELLRETPRLLAPGGMLFMVNQGEWEWREASAHLENAGGLRCVWHEAAEGSLHASAHSLLLSFWTRDASGAP